MAGFASAQPPGVDQVLETYLRSAGGKGAWENVKSISRKGIALPGSGDLPLEAVAAAPAKWAFSLRLSNGNLQSHGSDGSRGWETAPAVRLMPDDQLLEEGLLYDPFLPLTLRSHFSRLALKGKERNGDREVWVVEATPAEGRPRTLFFDTATGLLTRAGRVTFDDYRRVGEVKVAWLVRYGWQVFQYSGVELNAVVEAARFAIPEMPKPAPQEPLPSAQSVIDRYLEVTGGESAWRELRSQSGKGIGREGATESFELETLARRSGQWVLSLRAGGQPLATQASDGATAWERTGETLKDLSGGSRAESESLAMFDLPLRLKEAAASLAVARKEKRDGREVYVIDARGPISAAVRFDVESGLLHSIDRTVYSDYRVVDGVRVPYKATMQNGQLSIEFTEIKHNVPADEAAFRRPEPGPEFTKNFAGLEEGGAVALLRQAFGQGVTPSDGRMLYDLIVERGYQRALDIGTARGYAALWFALAVKKNGGKLTTIEIDPEIADEARSNFRKAGLHEVIDSRINDALLEIPAMKGKFDLVFMDPGAPLNKKLLDLLHDRMLPGGAIVAHNAANFATSQPDFLKAIQNDPRIETRIVPTPSGGISISTFKK
jgi:caffeoyl-CoA O-methyltransferase